MLFPIFSVLRRSAASFVYVDSPIVDIEKRSEVLMYKGGKFLFKNLMKVEVFEFSAKGSPMSAPKDISDRETDLWRELKLKDRIYTVFVGPESYEEGVRKSRIGLAFGVHRYGKE